jgi:hypothetical protein
MNAKTCNESPYLALSGLCVLGSLLVLFGTYAGESAFSTLDSADSIADCNLTAAPG